MMPYTYRVLNKKDVSKFKELNSVFKVAFDGDGYLDASPSDVYLSSLLEKEHFIALVAIHNEKVVGGLAAFLLEKWEQKRKEMFIYDLAVTKDHRRQGVATGMINALKKIAKERGAYVIFVQADEGDTPAIKLYESLGTKEDIHHFDITLDS